MKMVMLTAACCWPTFSYLADDSVADEPQQGVRGKSPFDSWDKNRDGYVSRAEFPARLSKDIFDRVDRDRDGRISRKEDATFRARNRNRRPSGGDRQRTARRLPAGVERKRDVVYATLGDRKLHLDLYFQPGAKRPLPLVIWIHGGGWRSGSKQNPRHALTLLDHGFAVASVEYRLSGEAIFPAAVEDCKAAVSFLRLNAMSFRLDPGRFGAWGSSAGGHLVALLGTTNDVDEFNTHAVCRRASPAVQAVCNWFGPTDFLRMNDFPGKIDHDGPRSPESLFIGGPIQQHKQQVARANPISFVSAGDPPMLLMHGESDQLVPYNQSELLHAELVKRRIDSTLYRVKGGDHGFRGAEYSVESLQRRVVAFFRRTLDAAGDR